MAVKKYILPALCILAIVLLSIPAYQYISQRDALTRNNIAFHKAVDKLQSDSAVWNDIVPFAWDSFYLFDYGVTREEMAASTGLSADSLKEPASEGQVALLFVKDKKVVCQITDFPSRMGYSLRLTDDQTGSDRIDYTDHARFSIIQSDGQKIFTQENP